MPLTSREHLFAQLVVSGLLQAEAYRRAYGSKGNVRTVAVESSRIARRPAVAERIAELRRAADGNAVLTMIERRKLLAETARRRVREAPSHGDRIAAIREDAVLAGERRTDGTQVNVGVDVGISAILAAIENSSREMGAARAGVCVDGPPAGLALASVSHATEAAIQSPQRGPLDDEHGTLPVSRAIGACEHEERGDELPSLRRLEISHGQRIIVAGRPAWPNADASRQRLT